MKQLWEETLGLSQSSHIPCILHPYFLYLILDPFLQGRMLSARDQVTDSSQIKAHAWKKWKTKIRKEKSNNFVLN